MEDVMFWDCDQCKKSYRLRFGYDNSHRGWSYNFIQKEENEDILWICEDCNTK